MNDAKIGVGDLPFPLSGSTLIVGPSNAGKTRLTARALRTWVDNHGPEDVVVLDFAPEIEHNGQLLGGRLSRFLSIPDDAWYGIVEAYAPRAVAGTDTDALFWAERNAANVATLLDKAPRNPVAVFINDATIPFQAGDDDITCALLDYISSAKVVVLNAFESGELGIDDPVSQNERTALNDLFKWADRIVDLAAE